MSFNPNKKHKSHAFRKDVYFLGQDKYGINYWLQAASFDCGWYWAFGYIESYTNNNSPSKAKDIRSHSHFDGLVNGKNTNLYDAFKEKFVITPFSNREIWTLCELMNSFYIARRYADMLNLGGSHYTENPCREVISNANEEKRINEIVIPCIFHEVYKIMTPEEKGDKKHD